MPFHSYIYARPPGLPLSFVQPRPGGLELRPEACPLAPEPFAGEPLFEADVEPLSELVPGALVPLVTGSPTRGPE